MLFFYNSIKGIYMIDINDLVLSKYEYIKNILNILFINVFKILAYLMLGVIIYDVYKMNIIEAIINDNYLNIKLLFSFYILYYIGYLLINSNYIKNKESESYLYNLEKYGLKNYRKNKKISFMSSITNLFKLTTLSKEEIEKIEPLILENNISLFEKYKQESINDDFLQDYIEKYINPQFFSYNEDEDKEILNKILTPIPDFKKINELKLFMSKNNKYILDNNLEKFEKIINC